MKLGSAATPLHEREIHHILLWMPNWIGDVVLTLPALQALRRRYPDARITAVTRKPCDELLTRHPALDSVIVVPYQQEDSVLDKLQFARNLKKYRFDVGVVFPNSLRSAIMVYLSGARARLGYPTERRGFLLTHPIPVTSEIKHTRYRVDYFFNLLSPLKLDPPEKQFAPLVDKKADQEIRQFLFGIGLRKKDILVTVHPGTSKPPRAWHAERFGILCQKMIKDHGTRIVLLGNEKEKDLLEQIRGFCAPEMARIVPSFNLMEITHLLKRSHFFIGNDSGMMHLAAMVGTPLVGIFGPGDPATTGPFIDPEKREIVTKNYACSPCRQRFFKECKPSPHNKPYCLEDISVKDVSDAVERMIQKIREKRVHQEQVASET